MMRAIKVVVAVFVVVAVHAGGLPAHGQVELKWKLVKGQTFVIEEVLTITQTTTVAGNRTRTKTKQTTLSTIRVLDVVKDGVKDGEEQGSVKLEMRLDSMTATGHGAVYAATYKKMAGALFQVSLDPNMKITKFEGYDALVTAVAGGIPRQADIFRNLVSEETIKRTITQTFSIVPRGPVKLRDSWQRSTNLPLGPLGQMAVDLTFTYAGKKRLKGVSCEQIKLQAEAEYQLPKAKGQTLVITKADVHIQDYDGTVYFDTTKGRLVRTDQKTRLKGTFEVKTPQGTAPLTLVRTSSRRLRVLDPKR